MKRARIGIAILAVLATAGCSTNLSGVTRQSTQEFTTTPVISTQQAQLHDQAVALDRMTRDLVRKSTTKGIMIGAAAGCGLAAATGAGGDKCLTGALAGGAIGGVIGHSAGKQQVKKRIEIVSLSRVMPSVRETRDQMALVKQGVPAFLSTQNSEVDALNSQLAAGTITQETHAARLDQIRESRRALAETLSLSAAQAQAALDALKDAKAQGQEGLDWYIHTVSNVEKDAVSARSSISLL
ncbi:MAG: hypothetical protein N4A61_02460 [Pelagimonas sp.]|nr:hypothetical protein [Pelagimonas sp.]